MPDWCSVNSLSPRKAMKFLRMCPAHAAAGSLRWLVTVDAMHTQVVTAKLICATLKSHYLMIVKSNQAKILRVSPRCLGRGAAALPTTPAATAVSRPAPCKSSPLHENRLPYANKYPDHS
ncbi:putative transposase for IS2404 [Mycobacterium ulcerans str. Harvey]|uniref:Transposase for IS2404 n=1 Tax=Mycobacterium ulcerans str. Harvey TaxID=1299332 RepID=A0ABN0R5V0_MYCUL|nr:putative transposase for IS2404 [Mycobacterium ulcerans str. Harvey]